MIEAYQTVLKLIDAGLKEKNISISELKITKVVARILKEQTFLPFLYKVTAEEKFKTFYFLIIKLLTCFIQISSIILVNCNLFIVFWTNIF